MNTVATEDKEFDLFALFKSEDEKQHTVGLQSTGEIIFLFTQEKLDALIGYLGGVELLHNLTTHVALTMREHNLSFAMEASSASLAMSGTSRFAEVTINGETYTTYTIAPFSNGLVLHFKPVYEQSYKVMVEWIGWVSK